jgi:hypothetical protein
MDAGRAAPRTEASLARDHGALNRGPDARPGAQGDWVQNRKKIGRSGESDEACAP